MTIRSASTTTIPATSPQKAAPTPKITSPEAVVINVTAAAKRVSSGVKAPCTAPRKGAIRASITDSIFRDNASDGMSLNERSGGAVNVTVENSDFLANGTNPLLPIDPEDGLDIDEFSRARIDASAAELVGERDAVAELGLI